MTDPGGSPGRTVATQYQLRETPPPLCKTGVKCHIFRILCSGGLSRCEAPLTARSPQWVLVKGQLLLKSHELP